MNIGFLDDLAKRLASLHAGCPAPELAPCPPGQNGDFTVNCFKLARWCGNPVAAAKEVGEFLASHPDVERVETVKAFVNITLKPGALMATGAADVSALLATARVPESERRRYLVEFSAPNTNKPQHLGHVRNNVIGMSLVSLLRRAGHDVVAVNLVNDRGIHICKSMLAYMRFGGGETPESCGKKGDHLVGDYYVKFNVELSKELEALRAAHPEWRDREDDDLFDETALGREARGMLRDWEAGEPGVRELWNRMNGWVFKGFDETYRRLGVKFDHTYLESQTYLLGKDLVAAGLEKGVFTRRPDGATVCDLGKLGTKVVLRGDGTSVYITQDMGTTLLKHDDYTPDTMIWVVGDEQNLHFQMLFSIIKRLGYDWADRLYHLSYGMVNLPNGRMKSREGTVVDADDLFDEMANLATDACRSRAEEGAAEETLRGRGEVIGLGALKFMLLKFNPKTTITFDPSASLRFEGDTGPYVQYAVSRIRSIGRKAAEKGVTSEGADWSQLGHPTERALATKLFFYRQTLLAAAEKRDCSGLVEYLLDLAKAFSQFYRECPIVSAETPVLAASRLALAESVGAVISDGLATLTIGVPDAM